MRILSSWIFLNCTNFPSYVHFSFVFQGSFFFAKDGEIHCPVVTRNEQILTKEEF